jgi:hypothetical protein
MVTDEKSQRTAYSKLRSESNGDVIAAAEHLLAAKTTSGTFERCENRN